MLHKYKEILIGGIKTKFYKVEKADIYPLYGYAKIYDEHGVRVGVIKIRMGLPKRVENFIEEHEKFHIQDKYFRDLYFWAELKANIAGFLKEPIGFFHTFLLTCLDENRRSYYIKKFVHVKELFKPF